MSSIAHLFTILFSAIAAHPQQATLYAVMVLSLVNGLLPAKVQASGPARAAHVVLDRLSVLTRSSAPGTLKWPLIAGSVLRVTADVIDPPTPQRGSPGRARVSVLLVLALSAPLAVACHPQPVPPSDGGPVATPSSWTDTARRVVSVLHVALPVASAVARLVIPPPAGPVIARALDLVSTVALPRFERGLAGYDARTAAGCNELSAATLLLEESLVGVTEACAGGGFSLPVDLGAVLPDVASIVDVVNGVCPPLDAGVATSALRERLRGIVGGAVARGVILRSYPSLPAGSDAGVLR